MIEIFFLGTAGSAPTSSQNLPAVAFRIEGQIVLMDTGEDVQRRFMQAGLGLNKDLTILISHMHADHVIGLPGILYRFAMAERTKPVNIYAPTSLSIFLKAIIQTLGLPKLQIKFYALPVPQEENQIQFLCSTQNYSISYFNVQHRIDPSFGFKLVESTKPGKFNPERAQALKVPRGHFWGRLQKGEPVRSTEGEIIFPHQVLGEPRSGPSIVYSGDTRPCERTLQASRGATLLIHEATFLEEKYARERGHTSVAEAADLAKRAGVKYLILTHFSNRHTKELEIMLDIAKAIFPNTILAKDLLYLKINQNNMSISELDEK